MRIDNPGVFVTLGGNQLIVNGSRIVVDYRTEQTGYSFRFAVSVSSHLVVSALTGGGNTSSGFDHYFGMVHPGGVYAEGVAVAEAVAFDRLVISAVVSDGIIPDDRGIVAIDDLGTAMDNRVNAEEGAPVAIYCQIGGIEVYDLRQERVGRLAVRITDHELAGIPLKPAQNMIIASQGDVLLSRISTGEYQVNVGPDAGGNVYVYVWDTCPPTNGYNLSFNLADPTP